MSIGTAAASAANDIGERLPAGIDGPFGAIAECALGLLGARSVTISTAPGRCPHRGREARSGGDGGGREPMHRPDRRIGRRRGGPAGGGRPQGADLEAETAILNGLVRISAALLEQRTQVEAVMGRWSDAFALSPSPTWIYDPVSLRFLDVNEAAIAFYGFSRDQFLGMTVLDIRPHEHRQRRSDAVRAGSDLDAAATWRHRRSDGRDVDVITHGRRIMVDGRDAVIVVAVDRTDALALRKDLTHTQGMLDAIIEALPIGLFLKDMQDAGRYLIYNPAMAHALGQRSDGIVGRNDLELFGADAAAEYKKQNRSVMTDGGQTTFEAVCVIPTTGDIRQFRTVKKPLPTAERRAFCSGSPRT